MHTVWAVDKDKQKKRQRGETCRRVLRKVVHGMFYMGVLVAMQTDIGQNQVKVGLCCFKVGCSCLSICPSEQWCEQNV